MYIQRSKEGWCSWTSILKVRSWLGPVFGRILTWGALLTRTITRFVETLFMSNSGAGAAKGRSRPQGSQVQAEPLLITWGPHIACLMQVDRWISRHRALSKHVLLYDNNTSLYNCFSINIYTHFDYLHKDINANKVSRDAPTTYMCTFTWEGTTESPKRWNSTFLEKNVKKKKKTHSRKICHWIAREDFCLKLYGLHQTIF